MSQLKLPLHKGLLWKEWNSNKGMFAAFLGYIFYLYPLSLLMGINRSPVYEAEHVWSFIYRVVDRLAMIGNEGQYTLLTIAAVVFFATQLVAEERKRNTFDLLLAMPFSRTQILANKYLFGVMVLTATFLVNGLLLAVITSAHAEVLQPHIDLQVISLWGAAQVVLLLTVFSFAFLFATLTGNSLAGIILTFIFMAFPVGFAELLFENARTLLGWSWAETHAHLGLLRTIGSNLSLIFYFFQRDMVLLRWLPLSLSGLGFFLAALKLFSHNPMERNGELLMFPVLEPVLRIGVTLCTMLLVGGLFGNRGFGWEPGFWTIARYLFGAVIGWVITHLAINKSRTAG